MRLIDELWTAVVLHGRERVADTASLEPPAIVFGAGELVMEEDTTLGACRPIYLRRGQTLQIGQKSTVGGGFCITGPLSVRIGRDCSIGANVSVVSWPDAASGVTEIGDGVVIGDAVTIVAGARIESGSAIEPATVVGAQRDGVPHARRDTARATSDGSKRRAVAAGVAVLFAVVGWWPLVWAILLGFSLAQRSNAVLRAAVAAAIVLYVATSHWGNDAAAGDNVIYGLIAFIADYVLRSRFPNLFRRYSGNR